MATTNKKERLFKYADERQAQISKNFPGDSMLGNPKTADHFIQWVTFFRKNF